MKVSTAILAMALVFACVHGECNNGCNGNGRCTNYKPLFETASTTVSSITLQTASGTISVHGYDEGVTKKDTCTCFTRTVGSRKEYAYTGSDCSLMTCPHDASFDAGLIAVAAVDQTGSSVTYATHNKFAECSDRGVCDRNTGKCMCLPGYEGKACQRTTCPNSCSGNGICKTLHEIAKLNSENTEWANVDGMDYANIKYQDSWDSSKIRGCECDPGWRGPDCSEKECPSTSDPLGGHGSESGRTCSGRGLCVQGVCQCHDGYFGQDCSQQRANAFA